MSVWITDWNEIKDSVEYFVCPIAQRLDGSLYLQQPRMYLGWKVKTLLRGCYAALEVPVWDGILKDEDKSDGAKQWSDSNRS